MNRGGGGGVPEEEDMVESSRGQCANLSHSTEIRIVKIIIVPYGMKMMGFVLHLDLERRNSKQRSGHQLPKKRKRQR